MPPRRHPLIQIPIEIAAIVAWLAVILGVPVAAGLIALDLCF